MLQHFDQAHHSQFLTVMPGFNTRLTHEVATDACEFGIGVTRFYFCNQSGTELVAGRFARYQGKSKRLFRCRRFGHNLAENAAIAAIDELQHQADIGRRRRA